MVRVSPGRKLLERRILAAKEGIDLLSVAGDLTTLRKKGERWRGKCPICGNGAHSDAFSLDNNLGLWHCFACGSGGDLVSLVELWGGFSVPEADQAREAEMAWERMKRLPMAELDNHGALRE